MNPAAALRFSEDGGRIRLSARWTPSCGRLLTRESVGPDRERL